MINHRIASAAVLAAVVAAGIAFAAEAHAPLQRSIVAASPVQPMDVIVLPMVQVIGHRSH